MFLRPKPLKPVKPMHMKDGMVSDEISLVELRWDLAIYSVLKQIRIKKSTLEDTMRPAEEESKVAKAERAKKEKIALAGVAQVRRFFDINMGERTDKELDTLDAILGNFQCFAKLPPVVRFKLYNCCMVETHARGTVLIREGHQAKYCIVRQFNVEQVILRAEDYCSNLYMVIRGKVRALSMVTFVKMDCGEQSKFLATGGSARRHKYSLVPFGLNTGLHLGPNDEVVKELATVLDLTPGMSFPPMKPSKVVLERRQYLEKIQKEGGAVSLMEERKKSMGLPPAVVDTDALQLPFSFIVAESVEVVIVSFRDLREILPTVALKRLMEQRSLTDVVED
ncbi:hypothetical protein HDU98_006404 [Podochytrium sp. JEL0797]|nr:hypothetical protein HDU98_006404 [Podochytrium sp. JEL0797]